MKMSWKTIAAMKVLLDLLSSVLIIFVSTGLGNKVKHPRNETCIKSNLKKKSVLYAKNGAYTIIICTLN